MISSHRQQRSPESQIRLRLLHRLGIHQKEPPGLAALQQRRKHALFNDSSSCSCRAHRTSTPFCQPLKDYQSDYGHISEGESDDFQTNRTSLEDTGKYQIEESPQQLLQQQHQHSPNQKQGVYDQSHHRRIQFNKSVMVVPIPSRHAYSKRIKQAFWMDEAEIQATAERNRYEFASEGWDFHQVLEDEEMYLDTATGQLVHPCWVEDEEYEDEDDEFNPNIESSNIRYQPPKQEGQYLEERALILPRTNLLVVPLLSAGTETKTLQAEIHAKGQ
jgi:hypothetical protein